MLQSALVNIPAQSRAFCSNREGKIMSRIQYENSLRAKGFEDIGKGVYANVFAKPNSDKVVKVANLDSWPTYIKWATENGYAGKFAPKVDSLKFHDDFYVATMERLVGTMHDFYHRASSIHNELYHEITSWYVDESTSEATDLIKFVTKLKAAKLTGDWHFGNVMVRKDGQIVITDPSARPFDGKPFRIKSGQITAP